MWAEQKVVVVEGNDHSESAELTTVNDPMHLSDVWIEGVRVADYKMQPGTICRCNYVIALLERQSQWLLDQNVLTLFHRFNRLARVKSMGRRDVDRFNRRVAAQFMKIRIDRRVELLTKRLAWVR